MQSPDGKSEGKRMTVLDQCVWQAHLNFIPEHPESVPLEAIPMNSLKISFCAKMGGILRLSMPYWHDGSAIVRFDYLQNAC